MDLGVIKSLKINQSGVTLGNGLIGQRVHPHGDREVVQVVQKLAKLAELVERNALLLGLSVQQTVQVVVVLVSVLKTHHSMTNSSNESYSSYQVGVPQQDLGKVHLRDALATLGELAELQLQHLRLEVLHEVVEAVVLQILVALLAEEVNLQRRVDLVLSLQTLLVVHVVVLKLRLNIRTTIFEDFVNLTCSSASSPSLLSIPRFPFQAKLNIFSI